MTKSTSPFAWPIRVYYEDTDAQGVVYYANYFRFLERARTEWLRSLGIEQDMLLNDERRLFVVVDMQARFLQPARFNEQLMATAELGSRARASFVIRQEIYRESLEGDLLLSGTVRAAYLDADTMKPAKLPDSLFERR